VDSKWITRSSSQTNRNGIICRAAERVNINGRAPFEIDRLFLAIFMHYSNSGKDGCMWAFGATLGHLARASKGKAIRAWLFNKERPLKNYCPLGNGMEPSGFLTRKPPGGEREPRFEGENKKPQNPKNPI